MMYCWCHILLLPTILQAPQISHGSSWETRKAAAPAEEISGGRPQGLHSRHGGSGIRRGASAVAGQGARDSTEK